MSRQNQGLIKPVEHWFAVNEALHFPFIHIDGEFVLTILPGREYSWVNMTTCIVIIAQRFGTVSGLKQVINNIINPSYPLYRLSCYHNNKTQLTAKRLHFSLQIINFSFIITWVTTRMTKNLSSCSSRFSFDLGLSLRRFVELSTNFCLAKCLRKALPVIYLTFIYNQHINQLLLFH